MTEPTVRSLISTALVSLFETNPTLVAGVTEADFDEAKFFLGAAPEDANLPYIRINHIYGGEPPKSPKREFDQVWMVCVISFSQPEAEALDAELRSLLVNRRLALTDNWFAWVGITVNGEYAQVDNVQGQQMWSVGAYYRIRGIKEI